jgi:hypothetical protein
METQIPTFLERMRRVIQGDPIPDQDDPEPKSSHLPRENGEDDPEPKIPTYLNRMGRMIQSPNSYIPRQDGEDDPEPKFLHT